VLCVMPIICVNLVYAAHPQFQLDKAHTSYFDEVAIQETCAYELYQNQYQDEMAKIQYLINRVRYSPGIFVRNNQKYNGFNAAQWLEYKIDKLRDEIKTVEDFIEKIGAHSRRSGKKYYMIIGGDMLLIKQVYYNELARLYAYERYLAEIEILEKISQEQQILHDPKVIQQLPVATMSVHKTK